MALERVTLAVPSAAGAVAVRLPPVMLTVAPERPPAAREKSVPLLTLSRWLIAGGWDVWGGDELVPALLQTLSFGVAGALLTSLAAIPIAWLSIRAPGKLQRLLEGCNYITSSLPGIVVALALVTVTCPPDGDPAPCPAVPD